ncbi:hypothetical protein FEF33_04480 [Moraxella osloensis]|nr:hypothetical protein FEF33_04480 [Moraxella osloensis]
MVINLLKMVKPSNYWSKWIFFGYLVEFLVFLLQKWLFSKYFGISTIKMVKPSNYWSKWIFFGYLVEFLVFLLQKWFSIIFFGFSALKMVIYLDNMDKAKKKWMKYDRKWLNAA